VCGATEIIYTIVNGRTGRTDAEWQGLNSALSGGKSSPSLRPTRIHPAGTPFMDFPCRIARGSDFNVSANG
jgi:hypothetical protein